MLFARVICLPTWRGTNGGTTTKRAQRKEESSKQELRDKNCVTKSKNCVTFVSIATAKRIKVSQGRIFPSVYKKVSVWGKTLIMMHGL